MCKCFFFLFYDILNDGCLPKHSILVLVYNWLKQIISFIILFLIRPVEF